jgi:3-hydroxyacyl-[acyl-carrier protein] dehydratase/trans-2-decenoyl-[acyl-carrier protein] isomerase
MWMGGPLPLGYDVIERKLVMIVGDATLCADGKQIYTAKGLRVGLFSREGLA